jgi:hypothetical protein
MITHAQCLRTHAEHMQHVSPAVQEVPQICVYNHLMLYVATLVHAMDMNPLSSPDDGFTGLNAHLNNTKAHETLRFHLRGRRLTIQSLIGRSVG